MKTQNFLFVFFVLYFTFIGQPAFAENLTLPKSLKIALAKNPQVIQAKEKVKAAEALMGQAVSTVLPHLSVDAAYGKNYQKPLKVTLPSIPGMPSGEFSTSPDEAAKVTSYSASLNQAVFLGGRDILAIDIGDAGLKISQEDLRKVENEISYNVCSAYADVLKTQKLLAVVKESVANLKKHLKQTEIFYQAGIGTKADVLMVQTQLANLRQAEIQASSGAKLTKMAFNSLLARSLNEEVDLADEILKNNVSENLMSVEGLVVLMYENRPEWRAFKLGKKISGDLVGMASAGFLPNIFLVGSIGRNITDYPNAGKKYDLDNWRLLLAGSWKIFDGLETPFKIKEARANFEVVKAQEQIIKDGLNLELNAAYLNLASAAERVTAAQIAQELGRKAWQFAEVNFQAHIGTNLAVLDAQTAYDKAQSDFSTAVCDLAVARAKINQVVGKKIF